MTDTSSWDYATPTSRRSAGISLLGFGLCITVSFLNSRRDDRHTIGWIEWTLLFALRFFLTLALWFGLWIAFWAYEIWVVYGSDWLSLWLL